MNESSSYCGLTSVIDHCKFLQKSFLFQNDFVIERSVVGTVVDGLSQLKGVKNISQFAVQLANGLGSNLKKATKDAFFQEVSYFLFLYFIKTKIAALKSNKIIEKLPRRLSNVFYNIVSKLGCFAI